MAHVFISYKRQDSAFARELRDRIAAAGMTVWMDEQLHAGDDWREEIDRAIREAFVLVVVVTEESRRSEYVTYEWACAWGANVRVLPVLLERTSRLHPRLDALHHRDFSDPDDQPFDLLINDLRHIQDEYEAQRLHQNMPRAVRQAFEELEHYRQDERLQALDGLSRMEHPSAFEALKRAANTAFHDDVRMIAALRVIQRMPDHCADVLPKIGPALTADNIGLRTDAITALGSVRDPDAVPDLVSIHDRGDDMIRATVVDVLTTMGSSAVPGLITLLRDGDEDVQQTVSHMLIRIGNPAVPALGDALYHTHTTVRFIAAHILGEIGNPQVVPAMIDMLDDNDIHLRRLLVYALGRLADPRAIPALITRLDDRDMQTVAATVEALGRLNAQEAVPALCHVVHRPEPTLKLAAVQVLGRLGDHRAAPTLIQALEYSELQFQMAIVEALGKLNEPEAVEPLTDLLNSDNPSLRRAVVRALADYPDGIAEFGLLRALDDLDAQIMRLAIDALIESGGRDALRAVIDAIQVLPVDERETVIARLRQREAFAVPALLNALNDRDSAVRWQAVEGLAHVSNDEVVTGLLDLMRHAQTEHQQQLYFSALEQCRHDGVLPGLIRLITEGTSGIFPLVRGFVERLGLLAAGQLRDMLNSPVITDITMRATVAELLGFTGAKVAIPDLLPLLNDEDHPTLRHAAAVSLGRLGAYEAVPKLIAMLYTENDTQVQNSAAEALERIGSDAAINALNRWRSPGSTSRLRRLDDLESSPRWLRNELNITSSRYDNANLLNDDLFDDDPLSDPQHDQPQDSTSNARFRPTPRPHENGLFFSDAFEDDEITSEDSTSEDSPHSSDQHDDPHSDHRDDTPDDADDLPDWFRRLPR